MVVYGSWIWGGINGKENDGNEQQKRVFPLHGFLHFPFLFHFQKSVNVSLNQTTAQCIFKWGKKEVALEHIVLMKTGKNTSISHLNMTVQLILWPKRTSYY